MTSLRITQLARRCGVPATTLRYYDEIGLLVPAGRSRNGYRAYSARDVQRLRFITRATRLRIGLRVVRELVTAWDGEDCADVQLKLADVVAARLTQTRERITDLVGLSDQLRAAAARLSGPGRPGRCHDACACSDDPDAGPSGDGRPPIACTLDADAVEGRVQQWRAVLARASDSTAVPGGIRVRFDPEPELVAEVARLAAAEHACCRFFDFTLEVSGGGLRLKVTAPGQAQELLLALFGPVEGAHG